MDIEWHGIRAPDAAVNAFGRPSDSANIVIFSCGSMPNIRAEGVPEADYSLLCHVNEEAPSRIIETIEAVLKQASTVTVPEDASHRPLQLGAPSFRFACDGCGQQSLHSVSGERALCLQCGRRELFVKQMDCDDCGQRRPFVNTGTYTLVCIECGETVWDR